MSGMESLFTTSAGTNGSISRAARDGTHQLALAVLRMAIFDLGAWCKHCRRRKGKCPNHCQRTRHDALRFLRGGDCIGKTSALEFWTAPAGWDHRRIKDFFSSGNEQVWIPLVIALRAPYRRARKGASAPQEATFVDLWSAYMGRKPITIPTTEAS